MVRIFRRTGNRGRWLAAAFLLLGFALGCHSEPAKSTDTDAAKRELERLNKDRQKEWSNK
jgi:hypothetical protein